MLMWLIVFQFHPSAGSIGEHGYDNNIPDMWSIFVAKGPGMYLHLSLNCWMIMNVKY